MKYCLEMVFYATIQKVMKMMHDTIAAISTALSEGAVSIVRLSGEDAIEIANKIFSRDMTKFAKNTINYGMIIDPETKKEVDEVLVSVFKAPNSYTAEDVVEINCHGGIYITRKILSLCLGAGARMARAGEFTERAFLNGRIDLTQAESVLDMLEADSSKKASMAIEGIKGSVRKLIEPLIDDLVELIAHIEVNIDYPEYDDVEQLTNEVVLPQAMSLKNRLDEILRKAESGRIMKQGVKTVILGKPNVGKSSLLNALLEEDKAIVTDIAGTTRDIVEGIIRLENVTLHLIDTAGIHETEDIVEKIGIEKSLQMLQEAELILVLLDGSKELDEADRKLLEITEGRNRIILTNKNDLELKFEMGIQISAQNSQIEGLIDEINRRYLVHSQTADESVLNNDRQIGLVQKASASLKQAIEALNNDVELDLVTIDFQACYQALKEILGEVSREDLLDAMFSRFCLGK